MISQMPLLALLFVSAVYSLSCQLIRFPGDVYDECYGSSIPLKQKTIQFRAKNSTTVTTIPKGMVFTQCKQPGQFALTFDDGPAETTPEMLDILKRLNVKATFFMICEYLQDASLASIAKQVFDAGHQIGNHEWNHTSLNYLSTDQVRQRMTNCNNVFKSTIGKVPMHFRAPYGDWNPDNVKVLGEMGYILEGWLGDSDDWEIRNADLTYQKFLTDTKGWNPSSKSAVYLFHDIYNETVDVAERVINYVRNTLGFKIVTAAECQGDINAMYF